MGFREGEGLGKYSQGRKDIVEASNQKGRRGLGLTLQGFDQELNVDWRDEPEVTSVGRSDKVINNLEVSGGSMIRMMSRDLNSLCGM